MRKIWALGVLSITVAACNSQPPPAPTTTSGATSSHSAPMTPSAPAKPWAPVDFDTHATALPPDYAGTDGVKFARLFLEVSKKNAKSDYETTAQHNARMKNLRQALAPLDPNAHYAFVMPHILQEYDADKGSFKQVTGGCSEVILTADRRDPDVSCEFARILTEGSQYIGSNAFGVSKPVQKVRGDFYALVMKRSATRRFLDRYQEWKVPCPARPDKARLLDGKTIDIALVGKISGAETISVDDDFKEPKITDVAPEDRFVEGHGIPFEPTSLVCFVRESGEILSSTNLHR